MADDSGSSTLVLDIQFEDGSVQRGFVNITNSAQKTAKSVGDEFKKIQLIDFNAMEEEGTSALRSLGGELATFGVAAAAVGVAIEGIKKGFELALEGEKIAGINAQFETLTKQAGIAGDALKAGLEKSADGLIDNDELLKTANSALINLGANAAKLPQVLDLARKATVALGGNLQDRYAGIVAAIESGNARALRAQGIIIDSDKAMRTYANSLGLTTGELNKSQQQQAILNAVLEQGGKKFKDINGGIQPLTDNVQRLEVALQELNEDIAKTVTRSGFFQDIAKGLADFAKSDGLKHGVHEFVDNFGQMLLESAATGNPIAGLIDNFTKSTIAGIKQTNLTAKAEIEKFKEESAKAGGTTAATTNSAPELDPQQVAAIKLRGLAIQAALKEQALSENAIEASKTELLHSEYEKRVALIDSYNKRIQLVTEQAAIERSELALQRQSGSIQTEAEYQAKLVQLNTKTASAIAKLELDKKKANDEYTGTLAENATMSQVAMAAFSESLQGSKDAAVDFAHSAAKNFRDIGKQMFTSVGSAAGQAFAAFGKAVATGQNALEAFLDSLLQSFGQMAIQLGTQFMLQGAAYIWLGLPNGGPLIAAGAALAAFGGLLAGLGGGKSASTTSGDTGGGVSSSPDTTTTEVTAPKDVERDKPGTSVNVIVQGDVFDSDATGMRIAGLLGEVFNQNGVKVIGAV